MAFDQTQQTPPLVAQIEKPPVLRVAVIEETNSLHPLQVTRDHAPLLEDESGQLSLRFGSNVEQECELVASRLAQDGQSLRPLNDLLDRADRLAETPLDLGRALKLIGHEQSLSACIRIHTFYKSVECRLLIR